MGLFRVGNTSGLLTINTGNNPKTELSRVTRGYSYGNNVLQQWVPHWLHWGIHHRI